MDLQYRSLVQARRWLALFQHHDAITGTSKSVVMRDYGQKLQRALEDTIRIGSQSVSVLLSSDDVNWQRIQPTSSKMVIDWLPSSPPPRTIVLFNSHGHYRNEMIQLAIDWPYVRVLDPQGKMVQHQINPGRSSDSFQLLFIAELAPLSLTSYRIEKMSDKDVTWNSETMAVLFFNSNVTLKWLFRSWRLEDESVDIEVYKNS